jgi:hypothetical protein
MTSVNTNAQVATQNTNINGAQGQSQGDQEGNLDFLFMAELDIASMARLVDVMAPPVNTATTEPEIIATDDSQTSQDLILTNSATDPAIFADLSQLAAQMLIQNNANNTNISNKAQSNQDAIDTIASQTTSAGIANQQLLNVLTASQNSGPVPVSTQTTKLPPSVNTPNSDLNPSNVGKTLEVEKTSAPVIETTAKIDVGVINSSKTDISKIDVSTGAQAQLTNLVDSKLGTAVARDANQLLQATPNVVAQALGQKLATPQVSLNGLTSAQESTTKILYVNPNYDESINSPKSFIAPVGTQTNADSLLNNPSVRNMAESRLFENTLLVEKIEQKIGDEILLDQAAGLLAGAGFSQPMFAGSLKLEASNTSLAAGPLYNEVMSAAKSGGGRIVLEVNPDNTGPIQIDLQIDQNGQALMIVNGASDATQARLEQGSGQLRQEFAQMGLSLSLDMRQNSASNLFNQGGNGSSNPFNNSGAQQSSTSLTNSNKLLNINTLSSNRSNADRSSSGVNLFA